LALKKLNESLARAKAPKKKQPIPQLDDTPERIANAIKEVLSEVVLGNDDRAIELLKEIAGKDLTFNAEEIGRAVGRAIKIPKVRFPDRRPVSYKATVTERDRKGDLVVARIDPIIDQ